MNFSLLLPTRKRPQQLEKCIDSIFSTTHDNKNIELRVVIDNDDIISKEAIEKIKDKYKNENIFVHYRDRGNNLVVHYYNWIALNFCKGKYLVALNDDCLFRTNNWDNLVYNRLENFLAKDIEGVVLGVTEDLEKHRTSKNKEICSNFPIISKKAVNIFKYFYYFDYFNAGSDDDICYFYKEMNKSINLKDICVIEHNPLEFENLDNNYTYCNDKTNFREEIIHNVNNFYRVNNYAPSFEERIKPLLNYKAIKFSLMIHTRKRPQQLERLLKSIIETTNDMKNIEIHFNVDNDDNNTILLTNKFLLDYPNYNLHVHKRNRGNSLVTHYINWCAINFCIGKYIITLNDDSIFLSKDWDINTYNILEKFLNDKPDEIVCGVCDDGWNNEGRKKMTYITTGFPLISKKAMETLGFFLDPCFMNATADDDICKLYATIGRAVDLRDIFKIHHLPTWQGGGDNLDNNYQSLQDKEYVDIIPRPILPSTVAEMRHFLDKRILILMNHIINSIKKQ